MIKRAKCGSSLRLGQKGEQETKTSPGEARGK
jgi:hypothetical protein